MKILLAVLFLAGAATISRADDPAELKAIEDEKTTMHGLGHDHYIMDLARLRFDLIRQKADDWRWQAVDQEIIRNPVPANSDSKALSALRLGVWHSPRHDYTYKANGTWKMTDGGSDDPDATHGMWSIQGNRYTDYATVAYPYTQVYTLILIDHENFIFTDGTHLFFEKRTLGKGLPLRRDGT